MTHRPYMIMSYSPQLRGNARRYGAAYRGIRVIETTDGEYPKSVRSRSVVRVVRDRGGLCTGTTMRSEGFRENDFCHTLVDHLNLLHQVRAGHARVTLARIADEENAELQRELIEAYDGSAKGGPARPRGWDTYLADVAAQSLHSDEAGELVEIPTAAEPIRAVRVTCPSTGRQYALRVPPATATARAGVAWTFGMSADAYQPAAQS